MSSSKKPLETLRDGSLKLTFWRNESDNGPFISVTPGNTYEGRDGNLKDSNSFSNSELLRMSELFREAHHLNNELRRELRQTKNRDQGRGQRQTSDEPPYSGDGKVDAPEKADPEPARRQTRARGRAYSR